MGRAFWRDLRQQGGDEFGGREHFEILFGAPVAVGAVKDAAGGGVVGDFLERERRPQEILREAAATGGIVRGDRGLARVERKTAMPPRQKTRDVPVRQGAGGPQPAEQGVAPEFLQLLPAARGGEVKGAVGFKNARGGDDMHMGMPEEKIAERLDGDDQARVAGGAAGSIAEPRGDELGGRAAGQ